MRADGGPFAVERLARRLHRLIDISLVALGRQRKDFLVGGIDGFESLAGLRRNPFAADKKLFGFAQKSITALELTPCAARFD